MLGIPIENPILHAAVGIRRRIGSISPVVLDLCDQAVLVRFGPLLDLVTFGGKVFLQLRGIPFSVWSCNFGLPIALDEVLKILAVGGSRVWDVVVR